MRVLSFFGLLLCVCFITANVSAQSLEQLVNQSLAAEGRPDADKARDANRKPLDTLEFFKLEPNQRVLELIPGGGWYTRILAPVLREKGKLYVALGTQGIEGGLLKEAGFDKVEVANIEADLARGSGRRLDGTTANFNLENLDLVLTFRNLHNFDAGGRNAINKAAYNALKPGGYYGVVDHTRRHNEPESADNWRRMDPVAMILEIQAAGFKLVDMSDLHYRENDALNLEVGNEGVTGKTDRFTLLFQKPAM